MIWQKEFRAELILFMWWSPIAVASFPSSPGFAPTGVGWLQCYLPEDIAVI
jgi:hypothetical protein